ncbi:unnamed protein product [Camellia sinensis]
MCKASCEREAIIAATMDERRNASFRISDECSTSPHVESHDIEGVVDSTQVPKKKTRGASKLKMRDKGKQKCDEIDFNERNQPVGPESVKLSTLERILAREMVPITIERWPDIPEEVKDKLWACVKLRFKIHDCHRKHITQEFGRLWRSHKSELSRKIRSLGKSAKLAHNIVLTKPDNVEMVESKAFVKQQTSKEFKAKILKRRERKFMNEVLDATVHRGSVRGTGSDLLQSTPHDNLPTSVNEVGSVTKSIEAMKLSKHGGSSIANLPTGLDMKN